jgi:HK97 family phage portal protein
VLHIFGMSLDGVVGESVIAHCRAAIGAALARDEYEGGFYNRGATFPFSLSTDGQLSDTARSNLKESLKGYQGSSKAFGIPVFEEGLTPVPLGSPMRDLEFVQAQQLTRTDIAVMFQLPPNALGGSSGDSLTYSTVELEQQHIALHAVAPVTETFAQFLTQDPGILPQTIFSCRFILDAMMRADSKTRAEVYTAALGDDKHPGWMRREEIRKLEDLSPADDKDRLDVPTPDQIAAGSHGRLGDVLAPGNAPTGAPAVATNGSTANGSGG